MNFDMLRHRWNALGLPMSEVIRSTQVSASRLHRGVPTAEECRRISDYLIPIERGLYEWDPVQFDYVPELHRNLNAD